MKTYLFSYVVMLMAIAGSYSQWGVVIYPTNHFYKDGNRMYVIDGRFIDSMKATNVCSTKKIDSIGAVDSNIMIYQVALNDTELNLSISLQLQLPK